LPQRSALPVGSVRPKLRFADTLPDAAAGAGFRTAKDIDAGLRDCVVFLRRALKSTRFGDALA